jgi:hypothetical protein
MFEKHYGDNMIIDSIPSEPSLNQTAIKTLFEFKEAGKEISLFIGRCIDEELPMEEGVLWVSMDIQKVKDPNNTFIRLDRIHLVMDCNENSQLSVVANLFTKVIVDQSTWKFFDTGIIERLTALLVKSPKSTLVFESVFQFFSPIPDLQCWRFNHISLEFPLSEQEEYCGAVEKSYCGFIEQIGGIEPLQSTPVYKEICREVSSSYPDCFSSFSDEDLLMFFKDKFPTKMGILSPITKYKELARQQTKEHLETLFSKVELVRDSTFPYPTRYSQKNSDTFFYASGLK